MGSFVGIIIFTVRFVMFRTRTGIFKQIDKDADPDKEIQRTRLMTQKSKMEFESLNSSMSLSK